MLTGYLVCFLQNTPVISRTFQVGVSCVFSTHRLWGAFHLCRIPVKKHDHEMASKDARPLGRCGGICCSASQKAPQKSDFRPSSFQLCVFRLRPRGCMSSSTNQSLLIACLCLALPELGVQSWTQTWSLPLSRSPSFPSSGPRSHSSKPNSSTFPRCKTKVLIDVDKWKRFHFNYGISKSTGTKIIAQGIGKAKRKRSQISTQEGLLGRKELCVVAVLEPRPDQLRRPIHLKNSLT